MQHPEKQGNAESGRFQIDDDLETKKVRQRIAELEQKIKSGPVSTEEGKEYLRLLDLIPNKYA